MTREEKIAILKDIIDGEIIHPQVRKSVGEWAIKALEQEPCEDCISRAEILNRFAHLNEVYTFASIGDIRKVINDMPSIQPKPKMGHWIYDKSIENWRCSECKETPKTMGYCGSANFMAEHFKFCNHCGCRMVEPQESEDKNGLDI